MARGTVRFAGQKIPTLFYAQNEEGTGKSFSEALILASTKVPIL